jgi:putative transposase
VSRETVSKITDQVLEEMTAWMCRQVRNKPIYVVIGVSVNGERDILGLWAATATRAPSSGCRC